MSSALNYEAIFKNLVQDSRYQANLDWGKPRPGHPEGTIRAHIAELEENLEQLSPKLCDQQYWQLKILIHTHDTFKANAEPNVPISHPHSHSSLARAFLSEYCEDPELLAIVQCHDEPYALYIQFEIKHKPNQERFERLLHAIQDWDLFLAFNIIDNSTAGKSPKPLHWFFRRIVGQIHSRFTEADLLR
jgi:hypothetical protein